MNVNYIDFDMYSKRIGLFYQKKEKIGTLFGLILTIIYISVSILLFIIYTSDVVNHRTIRVHDSTIYPREAPSIDLDKNLFYFAFGVEAPTGTTRFIDPTIYYPKVYFFDKIKDGGNLKTIYEEELKVERCDDTKFGEDYKSLLVSGELNNSYCVEDINLTLKGGFKYDRISYIRIGIYPCINTTENNNHCKSQEIIDANLSGAYFSLLAKDIGLDPSNYSNPIIPTFQDLYTTIDKAFFRDFILYFGITEVQTDEGLFYEEINSQKLIQFRKESKTFYFRDEENYYNGKTMCAIQFRLGDDIRVQKRSYNKMTEVFATTGGYMQLISTVFTIISILTNKLIYEVKLSNSLFNFYPSKRKISVKTEFTKLIDNLNKTKFNSFFYNKINKTEIGRKFNNSILNSSDKNSNSLIIQEYNINRLKNKNDQRNSNNIIKTPSKILKINNNSIIEPNNDNNNYSKIEEDKNKNNNNSKNEDNKNDKNNNRSKISLLPYGIDIYSSNNNSKLHHLNKNKNDELRHSDYIIEKNNKINDYDAKNVKISMLYYYCFSNCRKDKEDIKLFNIGISFYRKKMDIIHLFNIILLIEKFATKYE